MQSPKTAEMPENEGKRPRGRPAKPIPVTPGIKAGLETSAVFWDMGAIEVINKPEATELLKALFADSDPVVAYWKKGILVRARFRLRSEDRWGDVLEYLAKVAKKPRPGLWHGDR